MPKIHSDKCLVYNSKPIPVSGGFGLLGCGGGSGFGGLDLDFCGRRRFGFRFAVESGGLELHQEVEAGLDVAVQPGFALGEHVHRFGVNHESVRVADGVFDFDDVVVEVFVGEDLAVGEHVFFNGPEPVESPAVEGYASCEVDLGATPGVEVLDEFADKL